MSSGKNHEGYSDPTASKAVNKVNAEMPPRIYEIYQKLNALANIMGLEITGLKDKKTGKKWRKT